MKLLTYLAIALLIFAGSAWAGDLEDGVTAYWTEDYATALKKFKSAAAKKNARAQLGLGDMYFHGYGVVQDYAEAVRWYKLPASQGNTAAQYQLGVMYGIGQGVVQDYARAHMWFNLAAVSGDKDAIKNRDIVAARMTAQQISEAQKMARECQARNFKQCD